MIIRSYRVMTHRDRPSRVVMSLVAAGILGLASFGLTGCVSTNGSSDDGAVADSTTDGVASPTDGASKPSAAKAFEPAAAGTPVAQAGDADELMRELKLNEAQRLEASQAATRAAEKLLRDLDLTGAEREVEKALRLDGNNQTAKDLHDRILMLLGDQRGELRDGSRMEIERERVRKQQAILEIQRMLLDAKRQFGNADYDAAVKSYDRVLERIEWFPYQYDLSAERTTALEGKREADAKSQEQAATERRLREEGAAQSADYERERSQRFVQNRIDRLMERVRDKMAAKDYADVVELCDKVLELDRTHAQAAGFRRRASELRHMYERLETAERQRGEWEATFLRQREGEIPYHKIFNFPPRDDWQRIRQKSLGLQKRLTGEVTTRDEAIELALQKRIDVPGFEDRPFQEVMDLLAELSGVNFVLTKEAMDAIADADEPVKLTAVSDLPIKNVLDIVLEGREPKFGYLIRNGALLVGPMDTLHQNLRLEFYEVSDLTKDHPDFRAPKLALDEDAGGGADAGAGNVFQIDDDEEGADSNTVSGDILVELVTKAMWGEDGEAPEGENAEIQNGKLVIRTTAENHRKARQLLESLRKSTGVMVTVESRFLDLQDNFLQSIGVNFGNPFGSNLPNPINDIDGQGTQISPGYEFVDAQGQTDVRATVYNAFSQPLGSQVSPFQLSDNGGFALQYNVLDTYILEAILTANAKVQESKKLDAPRVTAFNGQISHALVIDQAAYIKDAEVNQTGVVPVINPVIGILNSGSILQVKPTVSHDRKYVMLEVQPTLAVKLPSRFQRLTLNLTNLDVELPVLSVTKIKTTITVPDGGTVLVGGLKRTITQNQHVGPPWISHIPGLNLLFGRKGEARMQSNLFVLINAKITVIRDEERAQFN